MNEIKTAYARLKREWPGLVQRLRPPGVKGVPDFMLAEQRCAIFTEVKWCDSENVRVKLEPAQADVLDKYAWYRLNARVLVLTPAGWYVFLPAFQGRDMYCRDAYAHTTGKLTRAFLLGS